MFGLRESAPPPANSALDELVASENARRQHSDLPPLTGIALLEHAAQQLVPCCVCSAWQADRARSMIAASFIGLISRDEVLKLLARGMCCKTADQLRALGYLYMPNGGGVAIKTG
jgi:hypothetical protein